MAMNRTEIIVNKTYRIVARISSLAGAIGFCLIGLMILVNIIGRLVMASPPHGVIEIAEFLLVAAVFISFSYAQLLGRHVRMETILTLLPSKVQCIMNLLVLLLITGLGMLLCWKTGEVTYMSWVSKDAAFSTTINLPYWTRDLSAFIGMVLLEISFLIQIWRNLIGILNGWKVIGIGTWES